MSKLRERWWIYCQSQDFLSLIERFCKSEADKQRLREKVEAVLRGPEGGLTLSDDELDNELYQLVLAECFAMLGERRDHYRAALRSRLGLNHDDAEDLYEDTLTRLWEQCSDKHYTIKTSLDGLIYTTARRLYLDDKRRKQPLFQHRGQRGGQPREMQLGEEHVAELVDPYSESAFEEFISTEFVKALLERIPGVDGGDERKQRLLRLRLLEDRSYKEIAALESVAEKLVVEEHMSEEEARAAVMSQKPAMRERVEAVAASIDESAIRTTIDRARPLLLQALYPGELYELLRQYPRAKRRMDHWIEELASKGKTGKEGEEALMVDMFVKQGWEVKDIVKTISTLSHLQLSQEEWRRMLTKCMKRLCQAFIQGKED